MDLQPRLRPPTGCVLFDASGQKRQVLGKDQGVIANHVTDVVFSGDDMVAATPAGLSFIARDGIRSLYAFHGLVNNHAYALGMVNDRLDGGNSRWSIDSGERGC